jgi:phosphonate transport system permease protein
MTGWRCLGPAVVLGTLAALVLALGNLGLLNGALLRRGVENLAIFARDLVPPDLSVLQTVGQAMLETLQIAFVGTMLGFILALPAALAASPLLVWPAVAVVMRLVLAFVRTVPSLLWAVIFVVAVGPNAGAGALAIALYSLGYLGKLFYELFEGVDPEVLEAVRGVGAGRLQLARYALLPEAANAILAQLVFMFEYNVRASSILGFVGAGGIGFYLLGYIQTLQYRRMMTALLITLVVVVLIDWLSALLRRRFIVGAPAGAPAV